MKDVKCVIEELEMLKKFCEDNISEAISVAVCRVFEGCRVAVIDAIKLIEEQEERIAIMTEGKEVKYTPEMGELYREKYWFCGNCNEPIMNGVVERKHLPDYCRLCGAKVDKGEEYEDQRTAP